MLATTTLSDAISISDVDSWATLGPELIVRVTRDSRFGVGVEGIALATLGSLRADKVRVLVEATFELNPEAPERIPFFESLFGIALVYEAAELRGASGVEVRSALLVRLWQGVHESKGHIGAGSRRHFIFRDPDYPVPDCLRRGPQNRFPPPRRFRDALWNGCERLGFSDALSAVRQTDATMATFLYQTLRNSHDHGRVDLGGRAVRAIRGVSIEKLIVQTREEIDSRRNLGPLLRAYVERLWEELTDRHLFAAFTVADQGPGIHQTLPDAVEGAPWDRLGAAFRSGVSRKPRGGDVNRGEGLPQVLDAARRLRALLLIHSAGLRGYVDFSAQPDADSLTPHPDTCRHGHGTSVTLVWPFLKTASDQQLLFSSQRDKG